MNMIPVVFGIDKSYVFQAFVVMASILKNSQSQYHFLILTKDEIESDTDELYESLRKYYYNFSLSIRKIENEILSNVKIHNPHLAEATYYRLLIPQMIPEYEKCIYLDSDILVNGDLKELFSIDLNDNYLGGVKDCYLISKHETRHQKHLGIPSVENYINAGVLLMNLKRMREKNLVSAFLVQAKKENLYEDQDVLNACCYGFIKVLPIKYNLFHFYQGTAVKKLLDLPYKKEEFLFDWEHPFILHLGAQFKPWADRKYKGAKAWWETAEIYKDSRAYRDCDKKCGTGHGEKREIEQIFDSCRGTAHIILWGYSDQGRDVCDLFIRKGIKIYSFGDNDRNQEGKIYREVPVRTARSLIKSSSDFLWVITCKKAYKAVYEQLLEAGIKPENIVHFIYNNKGKMYYLALDEGYYEEEIKTIALCENDGLISEEEYLKYIRQIIREADIHKDIYRYLYCKYRFDLWLMR